MGKTIGILGGMGPLATADLFRKITLLTDAACDNEHIRVYIDSNARIPDRTAAILSGGPDPVPEMASALRSLERCGADCVIMPCNTAHYFLPRLQAMTSLPFLSMLEATAKTCAKDFPGQTAAILATKGTLATGLYEKALNAQGVHCLVPDEGEQDVLMHLIYDVVKASKREMSKIRPKMQMIFQDPYSSLNGRMTVKQLIAEPLIINKICHNKSEQEERVMEAMKTVGLAERLAFAYPHELDGGRRQRIGIARALILNPEFIVCDEPVSALDVSIQAQILNLLMDLQEERNLTYMFITHDLSVVKHISDEIMVMYLGKCVEKASAQELFANPLHPYTKALLAAIPIPSVESCHKRRELLQGEVTSPVNPKPGCRFAARCPKACGKCREESMELHEVSKGHWAACPYV